MNDEETERIMALHHAFILWQEEDPLKVMIVA